MVEPGAPGQVPPSKGVPKSKGIPRGKGILPGKGIPRNQGVPKEEGILPGSEGHKLPGELGQIDRGSPDQMDRDADNPWAPDEETEVPDQDAVLPPSIPGRTQPAPADPTDDADEPAEGESA